MSVIDELKKAIDINKKIRKIKRKTKALDKIKKLTEKYNLELTRAEIKDKNFYLIIHGIMED